MRPTITSLAALSTTWNHLRKDYIETFLPFLATVINKKKYAEIRETDISKVCSDFTSEFGLIISYYPMLSIMNRAKKRHLLKKRGGSFIPIMDNIIELDFSEKTLEQQRKYEELLLEFIKYCKDRYNTEIDKENAEITLISFLKKHDLDILFATQGKSVLPTVDYPKADKLYLINSFIKNAYLSNHATFQFFVDSAVGHILASSIIYGDTLTKFQGKLSQLHLYFDTRFILRLFGLEGEERKEVYTDLLGNLKSQGAISYIFEHTYTEIKNILEGCLTWIDSPYYDPGRASRTCRYFVDEGLKQSDIERFIMTLDDKLKENGISKIEIPDPTNSPELQIDGSKLEVEIINIYKKSPYFIETDQSSSMIQKDVSSIAGIYRLRRGNLPKHIKETKHLFVTTNQTLAYANRNYEHNDISKDFFIPLCVTDVFLGTLIWIQSPTKTMELNTKKVIADCYSALQPDGVFIRKLVDEAEKLKRDKEITEDQYLLLRTSRVARELVMEKSLGVFENISAKVAKDALQAIEQNYKDIYDAKYREDQLLYSKTKNELLGVKKIIIDTDDGIDIFSTNISIILANIVFFILSVICVITYVFTFIPNPIINLSTEVRYVSLVIALLLTIANILFGFNIKDIKIKTREWFRITIGNYIKMILGIGKQGKTGHVSKRDTPQ